MSTHILITPRYPPATCGVGAYTRHLASALAAQGAQVVVVSQLANGLWYPLQHPKQPAAPLVQTLARLKQQHPSVMLFWQYTPYNFSVQGLPIFLLPLLLRLHWRGYRQAIYFHEVSVRFWGYGVRQAALALGQRVVANGLAALCARRFTSIGLYRTYFWGQKPVVVPVGANILPEQGTALPPLNPYEVACFANRADEALFAALAAVNRQPLCRLVLLGQLGGRQQQQIDTCIARYQLHNLVTVTGPLPEAELSRYLQAAQVFMHPQKVEHGNQGGASGKNGTLIAAMAHGMPIITTKGDMTDAEIFQDGENLVFVPYGDVEAYASALAQLHDAAKRSQLGQAAKASFEQYFAWRVVAESIFRVLSRNAKV